MNQSDIQSENERLTRELAEAKTALSKINEIRNSIIAFQSINWSEHIYPLVAALNEAGIEGMGYDNAKAKFGTMLERTNAAENEAARLSVDLAKCQAACGAKDEALKPFAQILDELHDTDTVLVGVTGKQMKAANAAIATDCGSEVTRRVERLESANKKALEAMTEFTGKCDCDNGHICEECERWGNAIAALRGDSEGEGR